MNIFYQLIGFGALIAMGLSYWQNDKRTILLWQVVANLIFAIHYTLLHARSGALCSFFQIVVLLLFLLQEKFNWSKLVTAIPIVAVFLLIAVVTYETPVTVLPIVASLAALLPFFQSRRWVIQVAGIASGLSWLVYVIAVRSYSGMVTESVLTIITAASLLKKESSPERTDPRHIVPGESAEGVRRVRRSASDPAPWMRRCSGGHGRRACHVSLRRTGWLLSARPVSACGGLREYPVSFALPWNIPPFVLLPLS